jgi:hypothetical protein
MPVDRVDDDAMATKVAAGSAEPGLDRVLELRALLHSPACADRSVS